MVHPILCSDAALQARRCLPVALQVAAMLLKQYKERFSGSPVQATWTYLRQTALDALPPNPLVSHDTEARHLRDPAFLVRMMRCAPVQMPPPVCRPGRHQEVQPPSCI